MSNPINPDALAKEITESVYHKKLQKALDNKRLNKKDIQSIRERLQLSPSTIQKNTQLHSSNKATKSSVIDPDYFKDNLALSSHELTEMLDKDTPQDEKKFNKWVEILKYNGHEIMKNLAHKINFTEKKDEFQEMFKYNLQQSKSHNLFISRFAKFKVGVVGQVLSSLGLSVDELRTLKKEAMTTLFEDNFSEMSENIYNTELSEILHGKSKKATNRIKLFHTLQKQLIIQMNNLGRIGFWSQSKLIEEKINQCQKIRDEFANEKSNLEYTLTYHQQNQVS